MRTVEKNWKYEYFNYRNSNFKGIRKYLKNIVWVDVFNNLECEEIWTIFKGIIMMKDFISEFVPKQTRRKTKRQLPPPGGAESYTS